MATLAFWLLVLGFAGAFAAQVARRVQLIAAAPNTFSVDDLGARSRRFVIDVLLQAKTINYEWENLKQDFLPLIVASVKKAPF